MTKSLLIGLAALAISATSVQAADNMAVHKERNSNAPSYGSVSEERLVIPFEGAGFSNPMDGSENYTFGAWVKVTDVVNGGGALLAVGPINHLNNNGNWVLVLNPNGTLSLRGHGGATDHGTVAAGIDGAIDGNVTLNEYAYICATVDNDNHLFTLYINGEQVAQKTMSDQLYFPANLVANDGNGYFCIANYGISADIDEAHIFNTALDAEYIKAIYGGVVPATGLKGYYTFDEVDGNKFTNLAADAEEGSEALYYKWTGSQQWGGWVNGTCTDATPTLVEGRELAPSAIDNIAVDNANAPVEYFNLNGMKVAADNLGTGIYVRRQGNDVKKVLVK